jgi:hypothetical protein
LPAAAALLAGLLALPSAAETIKWYSVPNSTNLTSAGAPMDGEFRFELGVFDGAFVPTWDNRAQWAAHWRPAQRVAYSAVNRFFTGQVTVADNNPPFSVGKPAWIWGFRGGTAASEWLLLRKASSPGAWTWPAPNQINPLGIDWPAAAATAVVAGSIDPDGAPFLMQSAAVADAVSPTTTWEQWRSERLAGEPLDGPLDDPDSDGACNQLEYVFGTPPLAHGPLPAPALEVVTISSQQFLQVTIPRRADHPALLTVEVSGDLLVWLSGAEHTVVVSDTPQALVVRDLTPLGPGVARRFLRLRTELLPS